jgi:glutaminase
MFIESQKIDPRREAGSKQTDLVITLLFACKNGDFEMVRRLYVSGENLNVVDYDGRSALHLAASEGDILLFYLFFYIK